MWFLISVVVYMWFLISVVFECLAYTKLGPASQPTNQDSSHSADAYFLLGIQKWIIPEQDLELSNRTRRIFIKRFSLVSRVTPYL